MPGSALGSAPAPALVLASGSAHRARLLREAGLAVTIMPPDLDEAPIKRALRAAGKPGGEAALALAEAKAGVVSARCPGALVIGGDQIAALDDDTWLDKPVDLEAARDQLRQLRGRDHVLETAVVVVRDGQREWSHLARPRLSMRAFSDQALEAVIAAEAPANLLGSVGGYRIEGPGIQLFSAIAGDLFSVQGLPLLPLIGALQDLGVVPR